MIDLDSVFNKYQKDVDEVEKWSEAQYNAYFADHFNKVKKIHDRLKSTNDPITDEELEWILTWLPLELMNVAEKLNKLKTVQEVIKQGIKQSESIRVNEHIVYEDMTATKAKETANLELSDDRLLVAIYDSLAERVSREISFSKELIMSSKKIWDARRNAEQPMPSISEEDLPEYQEPMKPSTYIK